MRSIPLAMTWEIFAHGRWSLIAGALGANVLPALILTALRHEGTIIPEDPSQLVMHVAFGIEDHALGQLLVIHSADALEHMAERSVPQIMKQRRPQADGLGLLGNRKAASQLIEDFAGGLHYAKAVAIAGMVGARVGQVGHTELADAAEALELGGVEQTKQQRVGRLTWQRNVTARV